MSDPRYKHYMSVPIYDDYTDIFFFPFPDPKMQVCEFHIYKH